MECRKLQKPPDTWPPRTWRSLCPGQLHGPRQVLLPCAEYSGLVQECQGSAEREILTGLILESTGESSFFRDQHKPHLFLIMQCATDEDVNPPPLPPNLLLNQNLLVEISYHLKWLGMASPLQSVLTTTSLPAQNKQYNWTPLQALFLIQTHAKLCHEKAKILAEKITTEAIKAGPIYACLLNYMQ